MIRPCSGLDSKSRQGGDNDEEQPCPAGSGFDDCAFPSKRTSEPSIRFQLHEADAGLRRQTAIARCKAMGGPDPYQERAREMARKAGLDPDGRIERLGRWSLPVWCTF